MEVDRASQPASDDFRIRQLRARDMLRGDLEGAELEQHVEERVLTTTLDKAVAWARGNSLFPLDLRPGLLRDRDDVDRRRARRRRALRLRGASAPRRARPT